MPSSINFFQEDISFTLKNKRIVSAWIKAVVQSYKLGFDCINFIYCSDNFLLKVNQDYLDHDYYTDIITFDNRELEGQPIDADIFISIDRVREYALSHKISFTQELHRVMIHGVLHLIGYQDHTDEEKQEMRKREEACLSLLNI